MTVDVEIIVVNYLRDASAIAAARQFVSAVRDAGFTAHCTVCDNSGRLDAHATDEFEVIPLPNPGYAGAINTVIDARSARVYLILTHEVSLTDGPIADLLTAALNPGVSAVGPVLVMEDSGAVLSAGKLLDRGIPVHSFAVPGQRWSEVDALDGACWAIPAAAWEKVGPLDEDYFLYWEETDWHARARELGMRPLLASRVRVSASPSLDPIATYYLYRNRYVYLARHLSLGRAVTTAAAELAFRIPGAVIRRAFRVDASDPRAGLRVRALVDWVRGRRGPMRDSS